MSTSGHDRERLIAGAMSGTSADGVDVALVSVGGRGLDMTARLVRHHHRAYPTELRAEIFAFRGGDATANLARLAQLGRDVSLMYAAAANEALAMEKLSGGDLAAVAAHGQTLYHAPPNTIQWFDPSLVASQVGCAVVSDFRRADLAAGGQGAPLVPFADYILFRHPTKCRVLLNLGGIANLTYVPAGAGIDELIAFDTGPANCVVDHLCREHDPHGPGFDVDGELARRGQPSPETLEFLLAQPFLRAKPPKSTDGPEMVALFESARAARNLPFVDRVATGTLFGVTAIQFAMKAFLPGPADELIVSGGGTRNRVVMHHLRAGFGGNVLTADELGVAADAKEALAFALLGAATLDGVPSNVPTCTGASRPVVLGSITPKP